MGSKQDLASIIAIFFLLPFPHVSKPPTFPQRSCYCKQISSQTHLPHTIQSDTLIPTKVCSVKDKQKENLCSSREQSRCQSVVFPPELVLLQRSTTGHLPMFIGAEVPTSDTICRNQAALPQMLVSVHAELEFRYLNCCIAHSSSN